MCQIIYAPKKSILIMNDLEASQDNNPDGFGISYAKDGRLFYCRKLGDFELFKKALSLVPEDVPLLIHFRWATHGDKERHNIHPFEILNVLQGDSMDMCMAHNGSVSTIHSYGENKSDTHLYVERILKPILKESPNLVFNAGFQLLVQRDIGTSYNKFIFLRGDGQVVWINKNLGHSPKEQPELWYANEYSLKSSYRSKKNKEYTSQEERWREHFNTAGVRSSSVEPTSNGARTGGGHVSRLVGGVKNIHDKKSRFDDTHENTRFFNFHELEKDIPKEIQDLLAEGEGLLVNKFEDKVSLQGWGWVQYGHNCARWDPHVRHLHKKWKFNSDTKDTTTVTPVVSTITTGTTSVEANLAKAEVELQKEFESKYDSSNFRILNQSEILNWILEFPDEAGEWAAKNGFFGSPKGITNWLQDTNGAADYLTDFIFNVSRGKQGKTLEEIKKVS